MPSKQPKNNRGARIKNGEHTALSASGFYIKLYPLVGEHKPLKSPDDKWAAAWKKHHEGESYA